MNEFEEKDYEGARSYANSIRVTADNIMDIFNDIDNTMETLYGSYWSGAGAEEARARYSEIHKKYDEFYQKVIDMQKHIEKVTARNEEADAAARNIMSDNN